MFTLFGKGPFATNGAPSPLSFAAGESFSEDVFNVGADVSDSPRPASGVRKELELLTVASGSATATPTTLASVVVESPEDLGLGNGFCCGWGEDELTGLASTGEELLAARLSLVGFNNVGAGLGTPTMGAWTNHLRLPQR